MNKLFFSQLDKVVKQSLHFHITFVRIFSNADAAFTILL